MTDATSTTPDNFSEAPVFQMDLSLIIIPEDRQRRNAKADATLINSIETHGVLNPIILRNGNTLVAGERRLDACRQLSLSHIPARNFEHLNPEHALLVELHENLARQQLSWQEEALAILAYHSMKLDQFPAWTQLGTASAIGLSDSQISKILIVAKELSDPAIYECQTLLAAYNFIGARASRTIAAAKAHGAEFADALATAFKKAPAADKGDLTAALIAEVSGDGPPVQTSEERTTTIIEAGKQAAEFLRQRKEAAPASFQPAGPIIQADFIEWAAAYTGVPFDVIHCDFPYGKNYSGANTTKQAEHSQPLYDDSAEVMFDLLAAFLRHQEALCAPQAHCIFWHDQMHSAHIIKAFTDAGWQHCSPNPLIWTKGNAGSPGDYQRTFRHCYETAHLFSRGDRRIIKLVADHFPAPVDDNKLHLSQKSVAMLRHFLSGVCDEHTRLLDPTCGGGSAIAAANLLGVDYAVGIELEESNAAIARFFVQRKTTEAADEA